MKALWIFYQDNSTFFDIHDVHDHFCHDHDDQDHGDHSLDDRDHDYDVHADKNDYDSHLQWEAVTAASM